jgi:hypothetical protein
VACYLRRLELEAWRLLLEACCLWPRPGERSIGATELLSRDLSVLITWPDLLRSRNFL